MTEADYQDLRDEVVEKLVELLKCADELGKAPELVAAEVMGAFQVAAQKALA